MNKKRHYKTLIIQRKNYSKKDSILRGGGVHVNYNTGRWDLKMRLKLRKKFIIFPNAFQKVLLDRLDFSLIRRYVGSKIDAWLNKLQKSRFP